MLDLRQKDKQQHLAAGIILTAVLFPFVSYFAVLDAILIGFTKEFVFDRWWPGGDPDIWDALATALGAVLCGAVLLLLEWL